MNSRLNIGKNVMTNFGNIGKKNFKLTHGGHFPKKYSKGPAI